MGSTKKRKPLFFILLFSFFTFHFSFSIFAQSAVPLAMELSRLEMLSTGAPLPERYSAYMTLARLHRLSGNPEAAVKACEGALALFPRDGEALLEQARLLISLGEHEKASAVAVGLLRPEQEKGYFLAGRYLEAQAEAFHSGDVQALAALANEPEFSEYRSVAYYMLWRLTDLPSWKSLLATELPQSPEAGIAGGKVLPAATPLWLLFPGRENITLSQNQPVSTAPVVPAVVQAPVPQTPAMPPSVPQPSVPQTTIPRSSVLQIGLFSFVENAQAEAENLIGAGFAPEIFQRQVNGAYYWSVCVPYGNDMGSMIRKLKDAGFESFPISR